MGDLIVDDNALDLADWLDSKTFLLGCPDRLIAVAQKVRDGVSLDHTDRNYLSYWRAKHQNTLF